MAYRFQVNHHTCINCGICLDMTRPSGEGELGLPEEVLSPIPGPYAARSWMMLAPVQVSGCMTLLGKSV